MPFALVEPIALQREVQDGDVDGFSSFQQSLQFEYALKRETKAFGYSPAARLRAAHVLVNRWGTQNDSLILGWHPYVP